MRYIPQFKLEAPWEHQSKWTVTGQAHKYVSNYDLEEAVKQTIREIPIDLSFFEFDSESGQFFAYAEREEHATLLFRIVIAEDIRLAMASGIDNWL